MLPTQEIRALLSQVSFRPIRKIELERGMTVLDGNELRTVCAVKFSQASGPRSSEGIVAYDDGHIDRFATDLKYPPQIILLEKVPA